MGHRKLVVVTIAALAALAPRSAHATFHLNKITQVFPGTTSSPAAQYIQLQSFAAGQNLVSGHAVQIFDVNGNLLSEVDFTANVANGANQATILIATPSAQQLFGITADLTLTSTFPLRGGKICFDLTPIDCIAWGNYVGDSTFVGSPFAPSTGLLRGQAATRNLALSGSPTMLDATDDTDNCANDFLFSAPAPRNNAGVAGAPPVPTTPWGMPLVLTAALSAMAAYCIRRRNALA
jgi:hypothetical protein